jgi:hypothetical protein
MSGRAIRCSTSDGHGQRHVGRFTITERSVRIRCGSSVGMEFVVAMIVLFFILAVVGLVFLAGLSALVVWLVRRTPANTNPAVGNESPAPPQ